MSLTITLKAFRTPTLSYGGGDSVTVPANTATLVGINRSTGLPVQLAVTSLTDVSSTIVWVVTLLTNASDVVQVINHDVLAQEFPSSYVMQGTEYVDFDTVGGAPAYKEGRIFYDSVTHTLSYYSDINGATMNIGQELWTRVRNTSGASITNGSVVYVTGATGKIPNVAKASATVNTTLDVLGVATVDIANNAFGYVTTYGNVNGINTSAYSEGTPVYLSDTPGLFTATAPAEPSTVIAVGVITSQHVSDGTLLVRVINAAGGSGGNVFNTLHVSSVLDLYTGARITGDFSVIPRANRPMFQTSVLNNTTTVGAIPNGTGTVSAFTAFNNSNPDAATCAVQLTATSTTAYVNAIRPVGGTVVVPLEFTTIKADGTTHLNAKFDYNGGYVWGSAGGNWQVEALNGSASTLLKASAGNYCYHFTYVGTSEVTRITQSTGGFEFCTGVAATARLNIDSATGDVYSRGGKLGYGTGAGGTVTQTTSKSTAVTLNKPAGQIVMHNETLAAGSFTQFTLNNSIIAPIDIVLVTVNWNGTYSARVVATAAGACAIIVKNETGAPASDAVLLNFAIIKGATS